jgi:hypothetical protein
MYAWQQQRFRLRIDLSLGAHGATRISIQLRPMWDNMISIVFSAVGVVVVALIGVSAWCAGGPGAAAFFLLLAGVWAALSVWVVVRSATHAQRAAKALAMTMAKSKGLVAE